MRVIFLGTPEFAVPSLEGLLETDWVKMLAVCTQPDRPSGRGNKLSEPPIKALAQKNNLLVLQPIKISKDIEAISQIKKLNPDILISCAFGQIFSKENLELAPHGIINVHASLLPKYRGSAPINWAILNGDKETGVSIMQTEVGLDSGPILLQEKYSIGDNETSIDLSKKLSMLGAKALVKALELIKTGKANFIPQDHTKAIKIPMLKKELGLIDWNKTSNEIHNKIRGLQPWPSAYTFYRGSMVKIWKSVMGRTEELEGWRAGENNSSSVIPGTIIEISDFVRVKTLDAFIDIYTVQPENKRILNVKDWVNGTHIKIGEKFE